MNDQLILYTTEDGGSKVSLRAEDGTVWLSQIDMAELFQTTVANINIHIKNIVEDGEQVLEATVKEYLIVRREGERDVERLVKHYSLEMILAVGYRVRSHRGVQFRRWATTTLKEYLIKGFAMDDERLKEPGKGVDYFDELLERIRDIRSSEKRFYQKIKDIYTTAVDYEKSSDAAQLFFKKVQNKMIWAVTGHTAAELIKLRSDPEAPNMGLTSWKGSVVRRGDVAISKNYLKHDELDELNRIVTMYLDFAEDQAKRRKTMTMKEWEEKLDAFLSFNERDILTHAGKLRADVAERLAHERYEIFDAHRREAARVAADIEDAEIIDELEQQISKLPKGGKK